MTDAQLEELDYSRLYRAFSSKGRNPVTDPRVLFKVLAYAHQIRIYSGRQIEDACRKACLLKNAHEIIKIHTPKGIKELGRLVENFDDGIWNAEKEKIVLQGNILKFSQTSELRKYLLSTGSRILVEASPYDRRYGSGISKEDLLNSDGTLKVHPKDWHNTDEPNIQSENKLGFVLMGIRDLFKDLMNIEKGERYNQ